MRPMSRGALRNDTQDIRIRLRTWEVLVDAWARQAFDKQEMLQINLASHSSQRKDMHQSGIHDFLRPETWR